MKIYSTLILFSFLCFHSIESSDSSKKSRVKSTSYTADLLPKGGNPNSRDHAAEEKQKAREDKKNNAQMLCVRGWQRNLGYVKHQQAVSFNRNDKSRVGKKSSTK